MPDYEVGNIVIQISVNSNRATKSIEKIEKNIGKIKTTTDKATKSINKMFNFGKLYAMANYTKQIAQGVVKMLTSAVEFEETINKFQVSMGQYYSRAVKFVNELTYAFNLSTESIMNYQATFKNMLDAIGGLSGDTTYQLSETLTRMAIDYASLFNTSIDTAMSQFQSVLSGQIRSIRTTSGYDVSEASIFKIYQELGGTKTVRQLDQIEKRLLRIIAVQQQMMNTGAVDDFQKTLNKTAQQMKQLSETFKEIGVWVGQLAKVYLSEFVEKVLAGAIAVREMLKALNIAKGYQYEAAGEGGLFGEIEESADEATEAVENLKTSLLGFDKLNILGSSTTSTTGTDYSLILGQIASYKTSLSSVENKATSIAEKILKWAGYTKKVTSYLDEAGNEISQISYELGENSNLNKIIKSIKVIGVIFGSLFIVKKLSSIKSAINGIIKLFVPITAFFSRFKLFLGGIGNLKSLLGGITGIIGIILTIFGLLYTTNESFRESFDNLIKSVGEMFMPILEILVGIIEAFMPIFETILTALADILVPIMDSLAPIFQLIAQLLTSLTPVITVVAQVIGTILNVIVNLISIALEPVIAIIQIIVELLSAGITSAIAVVISAVEAVKGVFQTVFEFIKALVETVVLVFKGKFDEIGNIWSELGEKMKEIWGNVWQNIKVAFVTVINGIITAFASFVNSLSSKINSLSSSLSKLWTWAGLPEIPDIPQWNPKLISIPELASGGVISSPTMAMVGEYSGASSNPEIVTPESLMKSVFMECVTPIAQAIVSGDKQVINAIEDLASRPIELNGRKVSENIYNDLVKTATRKGQVMFAK